MRTPSLAISKSQTPRWLGRGAFCVTRWPVRLRQSILAHDPGIRNAWVGGSNPLRGTNEINHLARRGGSENQLRYTLGCTASPWHRDRWPLPPEMMGFTPFPRDEPRAAAGWPGGLPVGADRFTGGITSEQMWGPRHLERVVRPRSFLKAP
jgi:hypothetical protein